MKKFYYLILILSVSILFSCQEEQVFCCDPEINGWIKENLTDIQCMTRSEWKELPEDLKNPSFGAFTPEQKITFWLERINAILELDWNAEEKEHIVNLESIIIDHPHWFDISNRTEEIEDEIAIYAFKWIKYAREELKWEDKTIGSVIASGNDLLNKNGLVEMNTSGYSIELASNSETACNCNQTYDFCSGIEDFCSDKECREVPYCGWLLISTCNGLCAQS
ncbi:MAG: bacteriocin fulvocin C-related protein [Bacteroides sp.]|nr:bacteriocin fulvocin C-related protein [Bacteroides sp.]